MIENNRSFITVNKAFPKISKKIKLFWGHPEFITLINELQHDTSDKPRAGFPSDVLFALADLETEHNMVFPKLARTDKNIWTMSLR